MFSRKIFLRSCVFAIGFSATSRSVAISAPTATPAPHPIATTSPKPSELAQQLASSMQRTLRSASLSDAMVEEIATDVEENFSIGDALRTAHSDALPPPDFVFAASPNQRP
jgi:hypothetical protein